MNVTRKPLYLIYLLIFLLQAVGDAHSQSFTSSNLPIVVIRSQLLVPVDSAWYDVVVHMGVIDNGAGRRNNLSDPFNSYNGDINIRVQGSSSVMWPKRSYRVELLNALHQQASVALMGLPAHGDWVFKASYQDKSFLRDPLAFYMHNQMGHYSSRVRFFELVINDEYRGLYQLQEKVKKDPYRVNIAALKPHETSGDDITGGYIISLDKYTMADAGWYSKYTSNQTRDSANYFLYYYPKPDSMAQAQKDYIKNYFDAFENALNSPNYNHPATGYRKYINTASFIDNLLVNELGKNVDGYRASTFFYKNKESTGDGKLNASPLWDFNLAFGNCNYNGGDDPAGWQYPQYATINYVPWWWQKLMTDQAFKDELNCRYKALRSTVLSEKNLYAWIDATAQPLQEALQRNFARWPTMGQYIWPNHQPVPADYAGETGYLKDWLARRLSWMDANITGNCVVQVKKTIATDSDLRTFPNPFANTLYVTYKTTDTLQVKIDLLNTLGQELMIVENALKRPGQYAKEINTVNLSAGSYLLRFNIQNNIAYQKLIKLRDN